LLARSTADHNWKLGLIQNCIYGVDIQPIAVQIAKLRCFVALLVDFDVDPDADNMGVPALPNLDFKFVPANTLIHPPSNIVRGGDLLKFEDPFFQEFAAVAKEYFYIRDPAGKKDLRTQLERLVERRIKDAEKESSLADRRAELQAAGNRKSTGVQAIRGQKSAIKRLEVHIARIERDIDVWRSYLNIFAYRDGHVEFFDPPHFFPEIGAGFDIVIGNPPYKQIQKYSPQEKADWVAQGYATYAATADIYCLFYERGTELLRPGGSLCYITSNKWMRVGYGDKLREFLCQNVATRSVLDFGMAQNFGAATTYTCITHLQRENDPKASVRGCYVSDDRAAMADPGGYFEDHNVELTELDANPWVILSPERTRIKQAVAAQGIPLERWDITINYGVKTGLNEAFYLTTTERDAIVAREPHATEIIVPLLRGRYIERYTSRWDGTWMINTHNGVKGQGRIAPINAIQDYPVVYEHLKQYEAALKKRQDKGDHWSNLRNCAYINDFTGPKIIYPNMTKAMPFFYDDMHGFFTNDKAFILTSDAPVLPYLVAALNSSVFRCCFRDNFPALMGDTYEVRKIFVEKIPIRKPQGDECELFAALVDYVQFAKATNTPLSTDAPPPSVIARFLEEVIDTCVMELYYAGHMAEKKLSILDEVRTLITPFAPDADDREKWLQVEAFYLTANAPKHPIRQALDRLTTVSPDLFGVIMKEGKV
ncbi:MAG: Eco57I restriction-modification methylase domain-containing protein, partial [Verrucomicrobia bacterium]|nr:Eco57I restriction-modification methylase domain-containing protein [Verrucomicrobiota bacterium]